MCSEKCVKEGRNGGGGEMKRKNIQMIGRKKIQLLEKLKR